MPPGDSWRCLEAFLVLSVRAEVLLASSRWRLAILLHTLQPAGQPPTTKDHPAPNVNGA